MENSASNTLAVAAVGHTYFDPQHVAAIRALVHRSLCEIKSAGTNVLRHALRGRGREEIEGDIASSQLKLSVISCLAAGADQIIAREGVQLGYQLQVVLPGRMEEYRDAIRINEDQGAQRAAREEFDRLLCEKSALINMNLPLPAGDDEKCKKIRHVAYDAATDYMLRHCDVLVAIVDILHRTDLGTTGKAICSAIRAGRPVLWIDPARPDRLRWLSHLSEEEFREREHEPAESCFVPDIVPDTEEARGTMEQALQSDDFVVQTLHGKVAAILQGKDEAARFMAEALPAHRSWVARWAVGLWESLIEKWLPTSLPESTQEGEREGGEGGKEETNPRADRTGRVARWWKQQWAGYVVGWMMVRNVGRAIGASFKPSQQQVARTAPSRSELARLTDGELVASVVGEVERERYRAKELAAFYAGAHRSSFLVVALLGVLAVALASFPTASAVHAVVQRVTATELPPAPDQGERFFSLAKILSATELVVILSMLAIYYSNRAHQWQEKSINYRLLSERFRHAVALVLVGRDWMDASPLPVQYSDHQLHKTWVEPFFQRSMTRVEEGLDAELKEGTPRDRFNDGPGNAGYVNACREYILSNWLEAQARYHHEAAVKYEALNLLLESVQFTLMIFTIIICFLHLVVHFPLLSFFASVFPAISGALASIAGQAEVVRLRDRSLSMHRAIQRKLRELSQLGKTATCESLRYFVETTAQNMLGEVIEWRVLFKFHPMSSPA